MKVIYFQDPQGNFGDELNRWIWPRLFEGAISGFGHHSQETFEENRAEALLFYGIGTILDDRIPVEPQKIIFGSGFGYGRPLTDTQNCDIAFVRGKKTAESIGASVDKALTDPAILLRRFFPLVPEEAKLYDVSFMPHHSTTAGGFWERICKELGINYISPTGFDVESVVAQISASRLMIAEAMHGAIVADTFRVPWIPVSSVAETNPFKWQDWCGSLNLEYSPKNLTPIFKNNGSSPIKDILNQAKRFIRKNELRGLLTDKARILLSDSSTLDSHRDEMDRLVKELQVQLLGRKQDDGH